ncbi:hypothetical protein Tco_1256719 [Tanacetum coccineum]
MAEAVMKCCDAVTLWVVMASCIACDAVSRLCEHKSSRVLALEDWGDSTLSSNISKQLYSVEDMLREAVGRIDHMNVSDSPLQELVQSLSKPQAALTSASVGRASLPAAAKATNLDSIIEPVIQVYFLEAQGIAPLPSRNTQSLVDELSSVLLI